MIELLPRNPSYERDVSSFVLSMPVAQWYGFQFARIAPGEVDLIQPYRRELSFRDGFFQASIMGAVADFAGASAALTLLPPDNIVSTIDITVKLIAPAQGDQLLARARVVQAGTTIGVSRVDVFVRQEDKNALCAVAFVSTRHLRKFG